MWHTLKAKNSEIINVILVNCWIISHLPRAGYWRCAIPGAGYWRCAIPGAGYWRCAIPGAGYWRCTIPSQYIHFSLNQSVSVCKVTILCIYSNTHSVLAVCNALYCLLTFSKPSGYFTYLQVSFSNILHSSHVVLCRVVSCCVVSCCVRTAERTGTLPYTSLTDWYVVTEVESQTWG
jgi:hypothetical protein